MLFRSSSSVWREDSGLLSRPGKKEGPHLAMTGASHGFPQAAAPMGVFSRGTMRYMYHSFLIHSSANGHLGHLHALAIVNSAAMNIGVHVSLSILVSSVCLPSSGIAGSYGSSISSFLRISTLFSIVAVLVCIPTNSVRGFPFLHTLSSIYCL